MDNINWYPGHMKKTRELIEANLRMVDLVIEVIDARIPVSSRNPIIDQLIRDKQRIVILNKSDLPERRADREMIARHTRGVAELSAREGTGVEELGRLIGELTGTDKLDPRAGMVANQRQLECVMRAAKSLDGALEELGLGQTLDAVSVSIEEALDALLELTGQRASEEIIDRVFENFCVGK